MKKIVLHIISILASALLLVSVVGVSLYKHSCELHDENYLTLSEHHHGATSHIHNTNSTTEHDHSDKNSCTSDKEHSTEKQCCTSLSETGNSESENEHNCCSDIKITVKITKLFVGNYFYLDFSPKITDIQKRLISVNIPKYQSEFNIHSEIYIPPESTFLQNCNFRL